MDYGAKEHYKIKHSKSEFLNEKFHINVIANVLTLFAFNFARMGYANKKS